MLSLNVAEKNLTFSLIPLLIADVIACVTSCIVPLGQKKFSKDCPGTVANILFATTSPVRFAITEGSPS